MSNIQPSRLLQDFALVLIGFSLVFIPSEGSNKRFESRLREHVDLVTRQLKECYELEEGLVPVGGYRARCTLDTDGLFVQELSDEWLDPGPSRPGVD
jgi:hypothetical protein